jgi:sortase A
MKRVAVTLVTVGALLLAFVAYQLWGTALYEHQAQNHLRQELQRTLHAPPTTVPTPVDKTGPTPSSTTLVSVDRPAPTTSDPPVGTPIGLLSIPRIGMDHAAIVEGTDEGQLQQGPGHYLGTPLPGQAGNAAIAGHRTTYGAPFYDLNQLQPGDPIDVQTVQGIFQYIVMGSHVVAPGNTSVLDSSAQPELTLTTCNPRYSAATRLVVVAALHSALVPTNVSVSSTTSSTTPSTTHRPAVLAGGDEVTALSGPSTRHEVGQAVLWGALTILAATIGLFAWRRGRRPWSWVSVAMGTPLTAAGLLICFEHVSLALPQTF